MELQTAGTTMSTQKKIYEKPRIEIVNLVADEMVLGTIACRSLNPVDSSGEMTCNDNGSLCRNS